VIARTSSMERLKAGEPMWDWDGSLPTMVGVLPRDGDAKDVRWFKGPSRNTLHFLNATDRGNTVTMELPTSSGERDPSQIRRWTFDLNSKSDAFQEEVVSTTPGFLPRMDDRYLSLDYRYAFISSRVPSATPDPKASPMSGGTQVVQRLDVHTGEIKQCVVEGKVALQESCFVPRANSKNEGDGYVMTIASNFDTMSSDMIITDAQHLEDGIIATVKLPFRLRSGTHTNWYPQSVLPPIKDELS
jgi:carotenoid cleavage dioxygenase-like enzyme